MQKHHWNRTVLSLIVIRTLVLSASAQEAMASPVASHSARTSSRTPSNNPGTNRGSGGFQNRLEKAVGLTPEQREAVRGLLAQQHEDIRVLREGIEPKYASIQERTDSQIRTLLNPEQQKKFDSFLARQKEARNSSRRRTS